MDASLRSRLIRRTLLLPEPPFCWQWMGCRNQKGYGRIRATGSGPLISVHRASYELFVGPIPLGLEIDHLCRNRGCVRPDHLEAVPHLVNVRRGETATRTHCLHGHLLEGRSSRQRYCIVCQRAANAVSYRRRSARV